MRKFGKFIDDKRRAVPMSKNIVGENGKKYVLDGILGMGEDKLWHCEPFAP